MKLMWHIESHEIDAIKRFIKQHENNVFVQTRIKRNIHGQRDPITIDTFWDHHVASLVTTQQRSGPGSRVNTFVNSHSFVRQYHACLDRDGSLENKVQQELSRYHLRFTNKIAKEISRNIGFISDNWSRISQCVAKIENDGSPHSERSGSEFIQHLHGFGPKQSRNLLQSLGITRYEIPIDSRITKWLNKLGFPVTLTATALADTAYYNFVSDGFQALARACDLYPCVLDAVIFSSYDNGGWTEENIVW